MLTIKNMNMNHIDPGTTTNAELGLVLKNTLDNTVSKDIIVGKIGLRSNCNGCHKRKMGRNSLHSKGRT